MAESEAVERNKATWARALERSRARNSEGSPAGRSDFQTPSAPTQEEAGDASLSWASGDHREVQERGDAPLSSDLRRVAGVSGTQMKAEEPEKFAPLDTTRNQRANPSGVDEIVNWGK
jgi:hypothetical protein